VTWGNTVPRIRGFNPWRRPDVNTLAPARRRMYPAPGYWLASKNRRGTTPEQRGDPGTARGHRSLSGSPASSVPALTRCNDLRKGFL